SSLVSCLPLPMSDIYTLSLHDALPISKNTLTINFSRLLAYLYLYLLPYLYFYLPLYLHFYLYLYLLLYLYFYLPLYLHFYLYLYLHFYLYIYLCYYFIINTHLTINKLFIVGWRVGLIFYFFKMIRM